MEVELKRTLGEYKEKTLLISHEPDLYERFAAVACDYSEQGLKI